MICIYLSSSGIIVNNYGYSDYDIKHNTGSLMTTDLVISFYKHELCIHVHVYCTCEYESIARGITVPGHS